MKAYQGRKIDAQQGMFLEKGQGKDLEAGFVLCFSWLPVSLHLIAMLKINVLFAGLGP